MDDEDRIDIPTWVPISVAHCIRVYETYILTSEQRAALIRLSRDERMRDIWITLLSRDRKTGAYKYPGKPEGGWLPPDWAQAAAMESLFRDCYGAIKDGRAETTQEENERVRADLLTKTKILRDIAEDLRVSNVNSLVKAETEISALERVAGWLEQHAQSVRGAEDPLTIKRHRSHAVAGGVLAHCEMAFEKFFGGQFRGLSRIFTEVGTGLSVTRNMGGRVKDRQSAS